MDDRELLRQYVESQSETLFSELVRRHLNLVYGTALRVVQEPATAQDVVQAVFIKLARKAWTVRDGNALPAWLYRAAYHEACNAVRRESRRRLNEAEAMKFAEEETPSASAWEKLGPLVDEAMQRLSHVEQNAILLRFFEGKSVEETSVALGVTEAAARMRVNRALEKIRRHFARGGVTIASGALVAAMTTHACRAAPAALAANVAHTSLAGAGGAAHTLWRIFAMTTKSKVIATAILVAAIAAIPLGMQQQEINQLEARLGSNTMDGNRPTTSNHSGATTVAFTQYESELKRILATRGGMDLMRGLLDFASHLDTKTTRALLEGLAKLPPSDKNKIALSALVDRLVRLDPKGALDWANSITNTHGRQEMLVILFDTWSNIDPTSALAAAQSIDVPALREALTGQVLVNMVRSNPNGVLAALQQLPGNRTTQQIFTQVFTTWGSLDPTAATTAAMSLPATRNRNTAIEGLIAGWATIDPVAALAWADKLPVGDAHTQAVNTAVSELAQQDPQAAATYATSMDNSTIRNNLIQHVGREWAQDDPQAAMNWLQQLNLPHRGLDDAFASYLVGPLSKVDPQAAANYVAGMPQGGGLRMTSLYQLATNWAEQDPQADLAWLQSIPYANRIALMTDVVSNWAGSDPAAATAYVESTPHNNANFVSMITGLAQSQASVDVNSALTWAFALPEDGGRDTAVTAVLGKLSEQDPAAAAAAIITMPASQTQTDAVQTIASNWATSDPATAAQWVLNLPAGALHDTAATHYNGVVQQNDPATAFNVALTISNSTIQSNQLNRVLSFWLKTDPAAAAAAVQAAQIPDATRNRLMTTLQNNTATANATPDAATPTN